MVEANLSLQLISLNERLLQYIWQFQYFNRSELTTTEGETLSIESTGTFNINQGPDFSEAKISVNGTTWIGSVELHLKSTDWQKHKHGKDSNYNNVVLHVVWEHDGEIGGHNIPTLELKSRISKVLLDRYEQFMMSTAFIPCENFEHHSGDLKLKSWMERLVIERLTRKSSEIKLLLNQNNYHWEETFWWMLARNFGISVNADAFEEIARSIPLNIISRHSLQVFQLEALLIGQSGLLNHKFRESYPKRLKAEYGFLQKKYKLKPVSIPVFFLRMRPGNFPTIRLAQLAVLLCSTGQLFSHCRDNISIQQTRGVLNVTASDYWHYHYRFDEKTGFSKKRLGENMIDNIVINTIVPMLFAYGQYHNDEGLINKALDWLEQTNAESNSITSGFEALGFSNKNARDSQAFLQLKNEYCNKKRCLECSIGNAILRT